MKQKHLISTISGKTYPFDQIEEFSETNESLEVVISGIQHVKILPGKYLWERFSEFLPFEKMRREWFLDEGNTPLLESAELSEFTGIRNLLLKNETQNPTWSFKDRGSLACIAMAKEMGENVTATISTGNMGHSISAYGARAGIKVIVFVPDFTPIEKLQAMRIHGSTVVRIKTENYSVMKKQILDSASKHFLRVVSGNGPIRVEGYKLSSFEMFEQMNGQVPDYIAVPTSACGHIRGLFKGYRELKEAGVINKLPKMIVVQAKNNSPLVTAIKEGKNQPVPFVNFHTIAEAITTGNPMGGNEIIQKARELKWLAEDVSEKEILESQKRLAESGLFVEPASATSLYAVKKLREAGKIGKNQSVVLMLTGSGLKDMSIFEKDSANFIDISDSEIDKTLSNLI